MELPHRSPVRMENVFAHQKSFFSHLWSHLVTYSLVFDEVIGQYQAFEFQDAMLSANFKM